MINSFTNQNYETNSQSYLFSINSEKLFLDENNYLLDRYSSNLDDSINQEDVKFQSDLEIEKNGHIFKSLNNGDFSWDKVNIEVPKNPFYHGDNITQKEDKILFLVKHIGPRRGRKRKRIIENINSAKRHDKYSDDNIKRKIQVDFINFITRLINRILDQHGYKENLYKISSISKQYESKKKFLLLKNMTIEQIISQDISPKYKSIKNKKINAELMTKIKKVPIIFNLLSANFLKAFRELYNSNKKEIKLSTYGDDTNTFTLPKDIEIYKDLVKKNKNDFLYVKKLNECLHKYFLC